MYFYRELVSRVSLTSWRNSLFSPLPSPLSLSRITDRPIHFSLFKISYKIFFLLLTLKFTPIFPLPSLFEISKL